MSASLSPRHLLRYFSSAAFRQLPRLSPRSSRPPVSVAHLFAEPKDSETAQTATPQETRKETEAPTKEDYSTWRPPNYGGQALKQSGRPSPEISGGKPQSETPRNRQGQRTQDSLFEPQLEAKLPRETRRKHPSAKELMAPLYRDALSLRWETRPPTADQLKATERFFLQYPPKFLWSAEKFKNIDYGNVPEVAFLGRSNVGKSSLLNALLNNSGMARTSSKPGHTRLMNAFSISQGRLVLLDMPGYGHASRPEWGVQIMKYLLSRKQFRRAFVLIDALHGPKSSDLMLLDHLGASGVPYQIVLSKVDRLKQQELDSALDNMRRLLTDKRERWGTSALGEVLGTAADPAKKVKLKVGMAELRWAVMVAGGFDGSISLKE